ncbi:MAG TPA: Ig-like domain-containing protein [Bacteroidota bacterium]|nr:Ig-like domain-containing protein [Bacteroidota bacterium]
MSKFIVAAAIITALVSLSCEGPQGPPGSGLGSLSDPSILPEVIYSYPPASSVGPYPELYQYNCGWEWCIWYSQFQVRFNKFMDVSSVRRAVRLSSPSGDIHADTSYILSVGGDVFILNPVDSLGNRYDFRFRIGTPYTMSVDSTAKDINGNPLKPPFTATFIPEPYFRVMKVSPNDGAKDISPNTYITLNFNGRVRNAIISNLSIEPEAGGYWWFGYDSTYVSFSPFQSFRTSTQYTIRVDGSAEDVDGNRIAGPFLSRFTTIPFRISTTYPPEGARDVPLTSRVITYFTVPLDTSTIRPAFHLTPPTPGDLAGFYYGTMYIEFAPQRGLLASTTYTVRIDSTLRWLMGDPFGEAFEYSFTTARFSVAQTFPVDGQTGVPRFNYITVWTNAPLDPASVTPAVQITPPAPLSVSSCDGCSSFQILPYSGLSPNTEYTVTIGASLETQRGQPLGEPYSFSFTTRPD